MGPGMSWYLIRFRFEGFIYEWDEDKHAFYNKVTKRIYVKPPLGAEWNSSDFISGWRIKDDTSD